MRMRHVIRPQGDVAFSKVSGSSTVQHVTESDFARALADVTVGWKAARKADVVPVFPPLELAPEILKAADEEGVPYIEIHGVLYTGKAG